MSCDARRIALALALAGCDACPPDYHVITGMRVLGTTFDPPVAAPGGAVTVRAVTADVDARDLVVAWYRCPRPFQLAPSADLDGGLDAAGQVAPCLAAGEFARGVSVRVPIDASGGARDAILYRPRRRWTDLVGVACAGGTIEPPPEGGTWPRCTGSRSVVFTASIPGPMDDGSNPAPAPASIVDLTFGAGGPAWVEGLAPEVPRCEGSRASCPGVRIAFRVSGAARAIELTGVGVGVLGAPDDSLAFVGYHATAMGAASEEYCESPDPAAVLRVDGRGASVVWVPPREAGEVTFWFTARRFSGGLDVVRRTARVR